MVEIEEAGRSSSEGGGRRIVFLHSREPWIDLSYDDHGIIKPIITDNKNNSEDACYYLISHKINQCLGCLLARFLGRAHMQLSEGRPLILLQSMYTISIPHC